MSSYSVINNLQWLSSSNIQVGHMHHPVGYAGDSFTFCIEDPGIFTDAMIDKMWIPCLGVMCFRSIQLRKKKTEWLWTYYCYSISITLTFTYLVLAFSSRFPPRLCRLSWEKPLSLFVSFPKNQSGLFVNA